MFCPKCGNAKQQANSYCRNCGTYLPDLDNPGKRKTTPEDHLKANTILNFLSAGTSLVLAILLYTFFLGRQDTPVIIYVTAGFLLAIFGWQIQIIIRTYQLKKHFKERQNQLQQNRVSENQSHEIEGVKTKELLDEANFPSIVTPPVTENTTRHLNETPRK